jgi:hypothetical protein
MQSLNLKYLMLGLHKEQYLTYLRALKFCTVHYMSDLTFLCSSDYKVLWVEISHVDKLQHYPRLCIFLNFSIFKMLYF